MTTTYLSSPVEIRNAIQETFSGPGEKWVVVGYVGRNGYEQLENRVSNLSVVCWPLAGATHPDGIRKLIRAGIKVYFCAGLHSKVYWAKDRGLIVCSANLSQNGLASIRQHEFGVYIDDRGYDIQNILSGLPYRKVTPAALHLLDSQHASLPMKAADSDEKQSTSPTFLEYLVEPMRRKWKITSWDTLRKNDKQIKADANAQYGVTSVENDNDDEEEILGRGDFVYQVKVNKDGYIDEVRESCWLRVEMLSKQDGIQVAVQIYPLKAGTPPPFKVDLKFRRAFKGVFNEYDNWRSVCDRKGYAKGTFIEHLARKYRDA
jgi:hypothetical protein